MLKRLPQTSVRIDTDLFDAVDEWIKTPEAKEAGYHSRAPFVNDSVRKNLERYTVQRFEHITYQDNLIRLIDNEQPRGTPYIEIESRDKKLFCRNCEMADCIHISESWNTQSILKQLKLAGIKKLTDIGT